MIKVRAVVFQEIQTISIRCMFDTSLNSPLSGSQENLNLTNLCQRKPVDANTHASPTN